MGEVMAAETNAENQSAIRVLLIDDHAVVRAGLRALIEMQDDMEVVAEAESGAEAIEKAAETTPDVAIVDISMPDESGVRVIERLREISPKTRSLALTMHSDQMYVRAVVEAGGCGYLVKSAAHTEFLRAIRSVNERKFYLDPSLVETTEEREKAAPPEALNEREKQVLRLVALGYTNREVAGKLSLSTKSIEAYRSRLRQKLGVQTRAELVQMARDLGLFEPVDAGA
jgi:two-component system response regulator NreC